MLRDWRQAKIADPELGAHPVDMDGLLANPEQLQIYHSCLVGAAVRPGGSGSKTRKKKTSRYQEKIWINHEWWTFLQKTEGLDDTNQKREQKDQTMKKEGNYKKW